MLRWIAILAALALAISAAYGQSSLQSQPTLPLGQGHTMGHMNSPMMNGNAGMESGMMQMMRMMESGMMGSGMHHADMMSPDMAGPMCGRQMAMMHMMGMNGSPASHLEARLAFAKSELAITAEQDAAWQAYAVALRDQIQPLSTHLADMQRMKRGDATFPAKVDAGMAMLEIQLVSLEAIREPAVALYGKLDDGQKQKADRLLPVSLCM